MAFTSFRKKFSLCYLEVIIFLFALIFMVELRSCEDLKLSRDLTPYTSLFEKNTSKFLPMSRKGIEPYIEGEKRSSPPQKIICQNHKSFPLSLASSSFAREKLYFFYRAMNKPDVEYPGFSDFWRKHEEYGARFSELYKKYKPYLKTLDLKYYFQFKEKLSILKKGAPISLNIVLTCLDESIARLALSKFEDVFWKNTYESWKKEEHLKYRAAVAHYYQIEPEINKAFLDFYECRCVPRTLAIIFDHGLVEYDRGNISASIRIANELLEKRESERFKPSLTKGQLDFLGFTYGSARYYEKCIEYLSQAISLDPNNKSAHLERAIAYFELGHIQEALKDYDFANFDELLSLPTEPSDIDFGEGMLRGTSQGVHKAVVEMPANVWSSFKGISRCFWAGVSRPQEVPKSIIDASTKLIEYVRTHNFYQITEDLAPEIVDICANWDLYDQPTRGEKLGFIIGNYGVDILATRGATLAVKSYRKLRRANALSNLKAMKISEINYKLIEELSCSFAAERLKFFEKVYIKPSAQGKHIPGHIIVMKHCFQIGKKRVVFLPTKILMHY